MITPQAQGGDVLGRYQLLMPLARGGMAEVWLARMHGPRGFRKLVALKTIRRDRADDTRMERMFIEEASLASQIHHPNTVNILDFGEHEGTLFIAMEWVEGEPLSAILLEAARNGLPVRARPGGSAPGLPLSIAVNVIGQVCKGLHAAHEQRDDRDRLLGIVHRDISPQNIIVNYAGTAKLVDFGIAKATLNVTTTLTQVGEVKGKFAYMSPEQVCCGALDRRSDIFSLGVLAYLLTTGRHPFRGESNAETVRNISSSAPAKPPRSFIDDFPEGLEQALLRAVAKDPEQRFATALEFLTALERAEPHWHESSYELELAAYMKDLFGPRQRERREQLRLAQQQYSGGTAVDRLSLHTLPAARLEPDLATTYTTRRRRLLFALPATAVALTALGLVFFKTTQGTSPEPALSQTPINNELTARELPEPPLRSVSSSRTPTIEANVPANSDAPPPALSSAATLHAASAETPRPVAPRSIVGAPRKAKPPIVSWQNAEFGGRR